MITDEELKQIIPNSQLNDRLSFLKEFNNLSDKYGIIENIVPAFIAQVAHESCNFHYLKEIASGKEYDTGRKAVLLGNTPQADGDGQKYKGRGYIQITGKTNYSNFLKWLGGAPDILNSPELIEKPHLAMLATIWFWSTHDCNRLAKNGDFEGLTKKINGGLNGYSNRLAIYNRAKQILKTD